MESEFQRRVRERTRDLEDANERLRRSQHMLATELEAALRLQRVATQLINSRGIEVLYDEILDAVMAILRSDFASIQRFYPERGTKGELRLLGHRGFDAETAKRWEWVKPTMLTSCGEALRAGRRVAVPDVTKCVFMSGTEALNGYLAAGIRAVQTTPLVSRSGGLLGMVSTHWREPHKPTATEFRALDVLARMAADLIERWRADEELRESEERFRHAADATPIMIWFSDAQNRLAFVNHEFLRFTGQTYEQLLGDHWKDPIHPDDLPHIQAMYGAYLQRPAAYQVEFRMRRVDGEYRHMLSSLGPRYAGETYLGWAGSTIDITDFKHRHQEDIARQKLESVGTLAGGIAHDFNNLLGAVLSQAELAQAELAEGSSPEGELNSIREIAMRGSKIVRELMVYAGKESKSLELVDVSKAVKEMLELLKISVSKHVTFKTDLQQDLPTVRAAEAQISQLVMNLATNASESLGDRDGVIGITTRRVIVGHGSAGETRGLALGEYVKVAVSDTGCGIPPELRTRIFDPFFSTKAGSRGFGLAVVHGIVKDLGGAINLLSEPGHGTTFEILLPSAEPPSDAICEPISEDGQSARQSQAIAVLVVEDEDALRQAVSTMLGKQGFHVVEAPDGSAALNVLRARANPIHVLFLDITIPGASARQVLLEARRFWPDLKVIVASAYSEEMAIALLQSGIDHFIRKPYQFHHLVRLLDSTKS